MADDAAAGWKRFTPVERAMARRMERTVEVPLATEFTHVDVVAAMEEVERLRADAIPATFTAIVVAATARALARYPEVAAEVDYANWTKRVPDAPDVGVAVAAERGLVVPVLRRITERSPVELARELDGMVKDVRAGNAASELFAGGQLSITNIGGLPIYGGTPLPASPQIAILGISSTWDAAVVVDGEIRVSRLARFTIALDHRALDGMTAARFLVAVKELVEDPAPLMAGAAAARVEAAGGGG